MKLILEEIEKDNYALVLQGSQEQLIKLLGMASSLFLTISTPSKSKIIADNNTLIIAGEPIEPKNIKPLKLVSTNIKNKPRKRSVSLEVIREIKLMAQNNASDKMILDRLVAKGFKINLEKVKYWRKNTPKELVMNG